MKQLILIIIIASSFSCQNSKTVSSNQLGEINFEVSGNEEATPLFNQGLMFLHSFEFEDAAEKFREAQEADPDFGMAYWGEAMTENHPLWREQEFKTAKEILAKLGDCLLYTSPSPRDQRGSRMPSSA